VGCTVGLLACWGLLPCGSTCYVCASGLAFHHSIQRRPAPALRSAGYLTQSIGMLTADASRGAFLSGFTVVVVPLMAGLCGTAKLKRSTWGAVVACLVGISLLEDSGAPASWGDFWSFISAVLFGAQVLAAGAGGWFDSGRCRPHCMHHVAWCPAATVLVLRVLLASCCRPPL